MGHNISALVVKGDIQEQAVKDWDLIVEELPFEIKLAYVDHYYTACWQKLKNLDGYLPTSIQVPPVFPRDIVLLEIAKGLKQEENPVFAVIYTDYFGGAGDQYGQVYSGSEILDSNLVSVNQALKKLGVKASRKVDEFDTIGLSKYRHNPEYLDKYADMADELGV